MGIISHIPNNQFRYYYLQLIQQEQQAYTTLLDGYLRRKRAIRIRLSNNERLWDIHRAICYDVPEIFYIKTVSASVNLTLGIATVYPEYRFTEQECTDILSQMEATIAMLVQRIKMLTEKEKIKQIHDFLIRKVSYRDVLAPYSHEAPGTLLYGIGVCEGISKAFKYIADRVSIKSILAVGSAQNRDGDSGHAWNVVYVNDQTYHIDVTFDYSMSSVNIIRYDYFLLSDKQIGVDHIFVGLPSCRESFEYYEQIGCSVECKKDLQKLVYRNLRPNTPLVFKLPLFSENKDKIVDVVMNIASKAIPLRYSIGHTVSLSYNPDRMIFQLQI